MWRRAYVETGAARKETRMRHAPIAATLAVAACLAAMAAAADPKVTRLDATEVPIGDPQGLVVDPDRSRLFVADPGNDRVVIVDPFTMTEVGSFTDGLDAPQDVGFEPDNRVLVADTGHDRVAIFEMAGQTAVPYGELTGAFKGPEGVLSHPNGRVYVAGTGSGNVVAFEDGEIVGELSGLRAPRDLAVTPIGDILVADRDRILLMSPELEVLGEWSGGTSGFERLSALAVLPGGAVVAADAGTDRLVLMSKDGAPLLSAGGTGEGADRLSRPAGLTSVGETVWVSDPGNERVVKYRVRTD